MTLGFGDGVCGIGLALDTIEAGGVGLHAPVDRPAEADDGQEAQVHQRAQLGCRARVVVPPVGDPGGLVAGVERLEDEELAKGVDLPDVVVAGGVRDHGVEALVHRRVVPLANGQREVGHSRLARVLHPVAVGVDEDGALQVGEPADEDLHAHVGWLAAGDLDVEAGEDVTLGVVPEGELVAAVGDVLDVERAVVGALADVDLGVTPVEVRQCEPGRLDRATELRASQTLGPDDAVLAADVGQARHHPSLHLAGDRGGCRKALGPHEAELHHGHELGSLGHLVVEAGGALLAPDVVVVAAFEARGLDPLVGLARGGDRRGDG